MLMICSAVCALMTLAFLLDAALLGCHGKLGRIEKMAAIPGYSHRDVVPVG
jgi:hypothetical protein